MPTHPLQHCRCFVVSLTAAVSFSVPDTVTASGSSGTDMLLPHIHCTRCWWRGEERNIRGQLKTDLTAQLYIKRIILSTGPNKDSINTRILHIWKICKLSCFIFSMTFQCVHHFMCRLLVLMRQIQQEIFENVMLKFHVVFVAGIRAKQSTNRFNLKAVINHTC